MALSQKLSQKLSQNLLMTPQLQQAIKLLQLGRLEYQEAIAQELLDNPILEESKDGEDQSSNYEAEGATDKIAPALGDIEEVEGAPTHQESTVDWEGYLESFTDGQGVATPKGMIDFDDRPSLESTLTRTETLAEHLTAQTRLLELSPEDRNLLLTMIGNLDRNGFLCGSYEDLANDCECKVEAIARVIEVAKAFEPPGVFARDLPECLIFQLERMGLEDSLAARIATKYLDKIESRKYDQIAKLEKTSVDEVYSALTIIRDLEPFPGRPFVDEDVRYIVPDIYVYKISGEYVISLNEDGLPKLRVSPYYIKILQQGDGANAPNKAYLNERLKAASWLIKSIHQRQNTIFKVTESIVKFQRNYLDQGIHKLRPLVLKDVADDIGMHESTVSRVTTNKYVHTPQGIHELKFFFTTGIKSGSGELSSSSIKEKIKNMIGQEPAAEPLSDQRIVEILQAENIQIARRTVAKYREALGLSSSARRKKSF